MNAIDEIGEKTVKKMKAQYIKNIEDGVLFIPTSEYKKLDDKYVSVSNKLTKQLNNNQSNLFDTLEKIIEDKMFEIIKYTAKEAVKIEKL